MTYTNLERRQMEARDILVRATDLLTEYGICRGTYAQVEGKAVPMHEPKADRFCSVGAIARATHDLGCEWPNLYEDALYDAAILKLAGELGGRSITNWNDFEATDAEIIATFRKVAGIETPSADEPTPVEEGELVAA